MKKYSQPSKKPETVQPKAGKQAPVDSILNDYKENTQLKGKDEEELLQGKFETTQMKIEEEEPLQKKENNTGLPDNLKSGIENLSGHSMDDVKVHYNSSQPNQLNAHAYAQGTDIHVAPGQEKHLPHEAWHVVQQKQGRVRPTMQMKGKVNVNDDAGLENEADVMGAKALNTSAVETVQKQASSSIANSDTDTVQRYVEVDGESDPKQLWAHVKDLVEKVYRRRKTLFEWSGNTGINYKPDTYEELAEALDNANRYKPKINGRVRPNWSPNVVKLFNQTWGGKRHRRHIIMSSLMRDAVYAVSDNTAIDEQEKIAAYNKILSLVGFSSDNTLDNAESLLVYVLHNNPANLVLDSGVENSAIGGLAHNINDKLKIDDLTNEFKLFHTDKKNYLDTLAHGFSQTKQEEIMLRVYNNFPLPTSVEEFREFLEMLYDNTAVDILTNSKLPSHAPQLINLHMGFVGAQSNGSLNSLFQTCSAYVEIGKQSKPSYQEIL